MGFFTASTWAGKEQRKPTLARCGQCGLSSKCFTPRMAPTGKGRHTVLFVAEAPGETEDRKGEQMIGKSGQILRNMIHEIGFELNDCWKTNAVICRPPDNVIQDIYVDSCRPNLLKTIKTLKPTVIVAMGISAVKGLVVGEWERDVDTMSRWVGWTIPSHAHNAWVCPTYHPSYLDRMKEDPVLMRMVKNNFKAAMALEGTPIPYPTLKELQDKVECISNPRLARLRLRDLATKKGDLAFDYETNGLKPDLKGHRIVSSSFCLNGEDTFACLVNDRTLPYISKVLLQKRLRKIASNLKFEERWTMKMMGHPVTNWGWDTMLAAHVLDNRPGITSLKFQAFVQFGVPDYERYAKPFLKARDSNGFNRIEEIGTKDLLVYNGVDSLLEYLLSVRQKELMRWDNG